ncbi:c-type cytochrome, partial [Moraxella catarrhalis]|uniref:c-type cytochrome n=1 Tax=Moraxella catarrhalis TaxID=480 RepID=UPI00188463A3
MNLHLEHFSDAHLATVLWDGVSGTSMPAWRQWDKADLEDVMRYVQSIQTSVIRVNMTSSDKAEAEHIYQAYCVSCHGADGRGNGPAAGALKPTPVNFHVRQPSAQRALDVLNNGIPGT